MIPRCVCHGPLCPLCSPFGPSDLDTPAGARVRRAARELARGGAGRHPSFWRVALESAVRAWREEPAGVQEAS